jgi:signal transduction histidine kinase/ActR/RegA family two-component response regulator
VLEFQAGYGFKERKNIASSFRIGEGLVGQCALEKERILLTAVPSDYIQINSGLGEANPFNIIVLPILFEGSVRAVIELASFAPFSATHQAFLDELTESIGLVLNTVEANSITEKLLQQSQSQAHELQSRQRELAQSNDELAEQAALLAERNSDVENKYREVEEGKRLVEEKARELAVSSKYKSEFIANMSHELRTPLNSLLVLAEQLADNSDGNLTERQVQFATVIRSSGDDLLKLLNDILDLAKVESNTVNFEISELPLRSLCDSMRETFRPEADSKGLGFTVSLDQSLPEAIATDPHRLRQVLKNLLSNAFKFTEHGEVSLALELSDGGWSQSSARLADAGAVIAISVTDSGIGIKEELQQAVFEAFAQVDGTASRKHGGTGLGLSISRTLVNLLGGEITITSSPGVGSTFTVYLPLETHSAAETAAHPRRHGDRPLSSHLHERSARIPTPAATNGAGAGGAPQADTAAAVKAIAADAAHSHANSPTSLMDAPPRNALHDGFYAGAAAGTTVLVVDDDFRNVFALTALLERGQMTVLSAQSGAEGLTLLAQRPEIDIVLMDIMMPFMNGYETMQAIRGQPRFATLPIIAITAKVVSGERERCISAGASEYISKPVDTAELVSALSAWLPALSPPAVVRT